MTNPKVVVNTPRKGPKVFTVVLTATDLIWMGVGAALALTIFFVFGLLVGRGYFPVQEEYQTPQELREQAEQAEPEVLRPEELTYPERIGEQKPKPKPKPAAASEANATEATAEPAPETAAETAPETVPEAAEQPAEQAEPAQIEQAPADPDEPVFDYVYQVAAFKEQAMAQDLAAKLGAKGLTTDIAEGSNQGVTWYRVRVLHTGTPPSTRELRDAVFEITQVKPMLVSKNPTQPAQ